ncbi:DUF4974 domain-containing protein [Puteibacter caeruleilacunae]|nr:DUF4974 domain-containing protein [Puteibacter caeruleilacunae]
MDDKQSIELLIIAELDGVISEQERVRLEEWIDCSKDNADFYAKTKDLWEASLANASAIADTDKEWKRFVGRVSSRESSKSKSFALHPWIKIAAVLIIGILLGNVLTYWMTKHEEPTFVTSIAPKGSISQTILPDGSEVFLNAETEIKYTVTDQKERGVILKSGEAWFNVAKNPEKPFVVHTPYYDVRVLGTKFNVKAYNEDRSVITTLEEGKIQVVSSSRLTLKKEISLKPGDQLIYSEDKKELIIRKVDAEQYSSWRNNELVFLKMNFEQLIKLLERRYGINVEVEDPEILTYHYTGTLKNESIFEVLNIIEYTLPISYQIQNQKVIISKKEEK